MKTEIENIIYNYTDEIPHILIRVITFGSHNADCPMESRRNTDY